ncbi:MAG: glycosyltransferase [Flavobacteriales bacterium]|nr:glycosyltransferase [Flavobacteriales bacterium]
MLDWGTFSLLEQILLIAFGVSSLLQLLYFLTLFIRIPFHKSAPIPSNLPPVSVIICARNEERNLRELIPLLMEQNYPQFEIIVVNDASWDGTKETLDAFSVSYSNFHTIHLDEEKQRMTGKKFALTLGLKAAKNEFVLMTDADCRHSSRNWITSMMAEFSVGRSIVLGYSPYRKSKGLLNALIRFDAFQIGVMYLSMAKAGRPYMGVGRNLSYRKKLFFDHGGFRSHYHLASGDDDLFINQVANKHNTATCIHPDALAHSEAKSSWKDWWYQKKRHFTTAPHYNFGHKLILGLFPLSWMVMAATAITLLAINKAWMLVTAILIVRYLVQITIFKGSSKLMGNADVAWLSPFLELGMMIANPLIYLSNVFNKPKTWK